jgi:RNA polymerase sigma factor (sigma-70 family)
VDSYRKKTRDPVSIEENGRSGFQDLWELADAKVSTPEETLRREELREAIFRAILDLPEDQRSVFVLTELEGRSFKEIQKLTGAPINTLLSRKRYAVIKLREKLAEAWECLEDN